jgi:flagellar basal-body rod protein FlgF
MSLDTQAVSAAMDVHVLMHEISARNVANASTPGFKRNIAMVESASSDEGDSEGSPSIGRIGVDLSQGPIVPTRNDMDFAIGGKGFFVVETAAGIRYTRCGRFQLNEQREIVTLNGDSVLGKGGPIRVPEGPERLEAGESGVLRFGTQVIGEFLVADFENSDLLEQAGAGQFKDGGQAMLDAAGFAIHHRCIEQSNVQPIDELVRMISSLRNYEACARSLKSLGDSAERLYAWAGS